MNRGSREESEEVRISEVFSGRINRFAEESCGMKMALTASR